MYPQLQLNLASSDDSIGLEKFGKPAQLPRGKHLHPLPSPISSRTPLQQAVQLQVGSCHEEEIHLLVLEQATTEIIQGCPWKIRHQPEICCKTGKVLKWGNQCFHSCFPNLTPLRSSLPASLEICATSIESHPEKLYVKIPNCYCTFQDIHYPFPSSPSRPAPQRFQSSGADRWRGGAVMESPDSHTTPLFRSQSPEF